MTAEPNLLEAILTALPELTLHHRPAAAAYRAFWQAAQAEARRIFGPDGPQSASLAPFGDLRFPYHRMGNIDSVNLFALDELIMFSFYNANRTRYRRVLDLGANLGLHSFVLSRCGFEVRCFEPDPVHYKLLQRTIEQNGLTGVTPINAAVSTTEGTHEFVRVLGNTTGSHLAGAKTNPYGDLERFSVRLEAFRPLLRSADLAKIDIEGHEAVVLCATEADDWAKTDAFVEINNADNAAAVFKHLRGLGVGLFAQKLGWRRVDTLADMPTSHRDGSLFITRRIVVPWTAGV